MVTCTGRAPSPAAIVSAPRLSCRDPAVRLSIAAWDCRASLSRRVDWQEPAQPEAGRRGRPSPEAAVETEVEVVVEAVVVVAVEAETEARPAGADERCQAARAGSIADTPAALRAAGPSSAGSYRNIGAPIADVPCRNSGRDNGCPNNFRRGTSARKCRDRRRFLAAGRHRLRPDRGRESSPGRNDSRCRTSFCLSGSHRQ